jgi:oligopeptide/dipeptide ABC transporter ATP-binding protein
LILDTIKTVTPLLEVRNLTIEFPAAVLRTRSDNRNEHGKEPPQLLPAVRNVSFSIREGEVLGLVGESGSGKSITSLAIMRLLPQQARVAGELLFSEDSAPKNLLTLSDESMRRLRGSKIAMIFQEPMTALNPMMRVADQIAEALLAHGTHSRREAARMAVQAMAEVAIPQPDRRARDYPHQLSGGMRQRVMIAMAIANHPQLLIADEPTTALDVTIQAQILDLLGELRHKFGLAMLFISHDLAVVSQIADRVAVMYAGVIVEIGTKAQIFEEATHPYTRGLLQAVPRRNTQRGQPLNTVEGSVPPLHRLPPGCVFEPRCDLRVADCNRALPELVQVASGHWCRCPVTVRENQAESFPRSAQPPANS